MQRVLFKMSAGKRLMKEYGDFQKIKDADVVESGVSFEHKLTCAGEAALFETHRMAAWTSNCS